MRSIPRSYHLAGVEKQLGIDRKSLFVSGLADLIQQYEIGGHAHYDATDVERWADRLARRRALIRLGVLHEKVSLIEAPQYDEYDFPCPECNGLATWKPPQTDEEWKAWQKLHEDESMEYPAACSRCEWKVG